MDVTIDGSYGEEGGQILRTALTLSALTGKAICIDNIRARRAKPGLAAQHLTAVCSVARVCRARVSGDELDSQSLTFVPQARPIAGTYTFDVASARKGGSAGSAPLILQTILLPLARASGPSAVTIEGGTHLPQSPFADYVLHIWGAVLREIGIVAELRTVRTGWYPIGGGRIEARIRGSNAGTDERSFRPLAMTERGPIRRIWGRSIAANLPQHIVDRMGARAQVLLAERGIDAHVERACEKAECPAQRCSSVPNSITVLAGPAHWVAEASRPNRSQAKPSTGSSNTLTRAWLSMCTLVIRCSFR
jgi:RNA 3'-terminal phosphate cyclase (ATP)